MILPVLPSYVVREVHGWTVHFQSQLTQSPNYPLVTQELENQLYRIGRVVPDEPLVKLRKIHIWVNLDDPVTVCAAYHPDAGWLRKNKANPDMARGLEIGNAANFISWTYEQPWMLLHELAHGYHDQFLPQGFENSDIKMVFNAAVASKRYDSVRHWDGGSVRHYALNNPMEFFAEATEAYFGQNDYFPFVSGELKAFDPDTYTLMSRLWGPVQKRLR